MQQARAVVSAVHAAVPGRARLRVAGLRRHPELKPALERTLPGRNGIQSAAANVATCNLLLYFDPAEALPKIIGVVEVVIRSFDLEALARQPLEAPRPARGGLLASALRFAADLLRSLRNGSAPPTAANPAVFAPPEAMREAWHVAAAQDVMRFWETQPRSGLSTRDAAERRARYGPNVLPQPRPRSPLGILLEQFRSLPVVLLMGSAVLSVATGGLGDAIVISAVVALNAMIGAATEVQAERTIASLMNLSEPIATVLRDGEVKQIGGEHLVPGDVLILARGSHVQADARLIEADNLTADESALTGESMPVEKVVRALAVPGVVLAERVNMVYRGTVITGGSAQAVVVATGAHTELGRVQALIAASVQPETPLQRQMRVLGGQLVWVTGAVAGAVFLAGLWRGYSALNMLKSAVSLAVAAVPEGLPTIATVSLASGVAALARRHVMVRRLAAVEALGGVEVVCFDKTGTLTLNQMSVVAAFAGMCRYEVSGGSFFSGGKPAHVAADPELLKLLEVCSLCSEVELVESNGNTELAGSATECALLRMAMNSGVDVAALRRQLPLQRLAQRGAGRNYMATTHALPGGRTLFAVKGSPAEVLALSTGYSRGGRAHALAAAEHHEIQRENERMAGSALRVLGVAFRELSAREAPETGPGLTWLGLVGIADPPREGLPALIGQFRQAGVKPVMVTGDQRATARAVGQALELNGGARLEVLDAAHFAELEPEEVSARIPDVHIFSRVSPAQKLQIVQAFQRAGRVVAMTGDGINDGPALKAADIGIALGQSGTRVAREVADVLLADDNIHGIVPAIREGRRVQVNLRKAIHYIASTNIGEIAVMVVALAAGMGQPLNPRQLLWINLITDVFPELALAHGPADPDLMQRPPADPRSAVIARSDYARLGRQSGIMSAAALAAYGWGLAHYGAGARASSMAFLTLTSAQLLHAITISASAPRNKYLAGALLAGFGALALSQFGLAPLLGTVRVGWADALLCAGASAGSLAVNEALGASRSST